MVGSDRREALDRDRGGGLTEKGENAESTGTRVQSDFCRAPARAHSSAGVHCFYHWSSLQSWMDSSPSPRLTVSDRLRVLALENGAFETIERYGDTRFHQLDWVSLGRCKKLLGGRDRRNSESPLDLHKVARSGWVAC